MHKGHFAFVLATGLVAGTDLYRPIPAQKNLPTDYLNEYELIKKKVSKLSANERRRIVRIVERRQ